MLKVFAILILFGNINTYAEEFYGPALNPDFSVNAFVPETGRENLYGLSNLELAANVYAGKKHALEYPVQATGLLFPAKSTLRILNMKEGDRGFNLLRALLFLSPNYRSFSGFWNWLGLNSYPENEGIGVYEAPSTKMKAAGLPMGVSVIQRHGAGGFTLSCAACHSAELFGKRIIGMTNRFPQDNLFFLNGKQVVEKVPAITLGVLLGASMGEMQMYAESRERLKSVGLKKPEAIGLDTSLAQVALSMARRAQTPWAERTDRDAKNPRKTILENIVADSKPAVWWNVKYKNRFLSDGSVVSGNPVFTNFLWNEIGRGVDIPQLTDWLVRNPKIVQELTAAVFASKAPKYTDFFGPGSVNLIRAKRGEVRYQESCAKCHGTHEKAWAKVDAGEVLPAGVLVTDTLQTKYFSQTPVKDVGTDPGRYQGMQALADALNPLEFSKRFGVLIETQKGYVPPPMDGIWARYPYFHNNSIPNLRAVMTAPEKRPVTFWMGHARDKNRDYSQRDAGYPLGAMVPAEWKVDPIYLYDTRKKGLSNQGHYERIFRREGVELFSDEDKTDLIEYLKTL